MNDVDKEDAEISNRCIYLIDQKVYFIPDENVLISKNYDEKIKLLSTATECLSTLISRQGQIIPREELMDSIWKKEALSLLTITFTRRYSPSERRFQHLAWMM